MSGLVWQGVAVLCVSGSAVGGQHGDGVKHDGGGWVAPRRREVGKYSVSFRQSARSGLNEAQWSPCTWCFPGASRTAPGFVNLASRPRLKPCTKNCLSSTT